MVDNNIGPNISLNLAGFTYTNYATTCGTFSGEESEERDHDQRLIFKEQDRLLPIANVGRIMKQILPSNAKISKEAKETMQECVSEFIGFVTGEASDKCLKEKRKTVNGDDICWALRSLGFDDYFECLKRYLDKYREFDEAKANQNKASHEEEREECDELGPFNLMEVKGNLGFW